MSENPYQTPATVYDSADRPAPKESPVELPKTWAVFMKWLAVCSISAAPSFYFGFMLSDQRLPQVLGMISGIALFVVGYTCIECSRKTQKQLQRRYFRLVTRIAYGTRMAISIIFPLGMGLDMIVGIMSTGLAESVFGPGVFFDRYDMEAYVEPTAFWTYCRFFFTTVVQGIFLNVIVFAYMGFVWAICLIVGSAQPPKS